MTTKHSGSCLCDQVQFEIDGDFQSFFLCHCKHCQKDTGSGNAANLFSTTAQLRWLKGQNQVKTFTLPGTRHVKSFCLECGSALPNLQMEGKLVVVPAGSLNEDLGIAPTAHIFCSSKAKWARKLEGLKEFEKFPS